MLDLKFVRENLDLVKTALKNRGSDESLDRFLSLEKERRDLLSEAEELKHHRNLVSDEIGRAKTHLHLRGASGCTKQDLISRMSLVSKKIKELDEQIRQCESNLKEMLLGVPNIPHSSVPIGRCCEDNKQIRSWGEIPKFSFAPKSHWDIGEALNILDFKRAAKIAGARFVLYKGLGARLERALINFMLDLHTKEHGYQEVLPPFLVNRESLIGTGQLPKFEEDLFKCSGTDYYLVPTAEVPVTNIHRDEILSEGELPIYYTAYTPCFRAEAGSYGQDTRGLIRQHQFSKVELVKFVRPQDSYNELESLSANAEEVLKRLNLPYQVISLCTGDIGFAAAKCYDIEVWVPSQGKYREISSCSNCEDFQARRANIKYRPAASKKPAYVHTLNGSGLAIGRTVVAILENYQRQDGSVIIPPALREYMDGLEIIAAKTT